MCVRISSGLLMILRVWFHRGRKRARGRDEGRGRWRDGVVRAVTGNGA